MRWLYVLLVVGLLGGLVGMALLEGSGDPRPPAPAEPQSVQPGANAGPATAEAAGFATAPVETDPMAEGQADEASAERTEAAVATDPRAAPRVLVVRGEPAVPVADAQVYFLTEPQAEARLRSLTKAPDRLDWPTTWGQRTHSEADGTAQLPPTSVPWLVAAVAGSEFGFAEVPPGRRTVTLTLQADESVTVRAITAAAEPVPGVPVGLLQNLSQRGATLFWQGTTGADGGVTARHFQLLRQNGAATRTPEGFAAVLLAPSEPPVVIPFAGRPSTTEPITLVVPTLGSLELQLTDHRGTPLLCPASVGVGIDGQTNPKEPFAFSQFLLNRREAKPLGTDPVRLPHIAVGASLRVFARFEGDRKPATLAPVVGPVDATHTAKVTLPLAAHQLLLAGRLQWRDATPVGLAVLQTNLWRDDRDILGCSVHTIADGRFDLVLTGRSDAAAYWLELRQTVPVVGDDEPSHQRVVGARVKLPALVGGARLELGTIVIDDLPPLASGLVVDDQDQVVAGADVLVQQQEPPNERSRDNWRNLPHLATRTAEDGTFVLYGAMPPGQLRVRADSNLHFADSLPLFRQGQQLRIRLERNGILRGRVLLPDWLADGMTSLTLRPFDEARRQRDTRTIELRRRGRGRFVVEPLRTGRYDALVTVRNLAEPLCVVPDVFVQPGEVHDGRLEVLDLRQSLFRLRLRAVDPSGKLLPIQSPILAQLHHDDGSVTSAGFRWQNGRAELVSGCALIDVTAFAPGCAPQVLTLGPGDHDIFLTPLAPACLELPGVRALCGPDRRVRVSVILNGETGHPQSLSGVDQRSGENFSFARWDLGKSTGAWLENSDTVFVPIVHSGNYQVVLRLHATDSEGSPQASIPLGNYELQADRGAQLPVRVPVDAAAVARAIESLQRQQQRQAGQRQNGRVPR